MTYVLRDKWGVNSLYDIWLCKTSFIRIKVILLLLSLVPYFSLTRCYYCWCGEFMVQDKWRDRWEAWSGCVQWYLIIYCSSWSPWAWGEYITIQNWGGSGMTSCCSVACCETSSWWEAWLGCVQWYLIIDYCSSWSPGREGSI